MLKLSAALAIIIILCLIVKYAVPNRYPAGFITAVQKQPMQFKVSHKMADTVWQRAPVYLKKMKHLYFGGPMRQNDTMIEIPYVPGLSFNKGNHIQVIRHPLGDSASIVTSWYFYDSPDSLMAKEFALYLLTGISRY
jgi:hypothetical protein